MLPLRYARRWQIAGIAILSFIFAATLMPAMWIWPDSRQFLSLFANADKWLHALTFVFLSVWFSGQYRPRSYWRIGVGLISFGVFIELCQRVVDYRTAEWLDIVADTLGTVVGLLIAMAGLGGWSLRLELWYAQRVAASKID